MSLDKELLTTNKDFHNSELNLTEEIIMCLMRGSKVNNSLLAHKINYREYLRGRLYDINQEINNIRNEK